MALDERRVVAADRPAEYIEPIRTFRIDGARFGDPYPEHPEATQVSPNLQSEAFSSVLSRGLRRRLS